MRATTNQLFNFSYFLSIPFTFEHFLKHSYVFSLHTSAFMFHDLTLWLSVPRIFSSCVNSQSSAFFFFPAFLVYLFYLLRRRVKGNSFCRMDPIQIPFLFNAVLSIVLFCSLFSELLHVLPCL